MRVHPYFDSPNKALEQTAHPQAFFSLFEVGAYVVETGRLSPNAANHANWTYCFLATGVEQVAMPLVEDTERVETVLMPLADVVGLARNGGLFQALHVGALFFALYALGTP